MDRNPLPFPVYEAESKLLLPGAQSELNSFCKHSIDTKPDCALHYETMKKSPEGYYQCPFGFTTRVIQFRERRWIITSVVASPRFGGKAEAIRAKQHPESKTSRQQIDSLVDYVRALEAMRADIVVEATKILPQALHELRKLNGIVLQVAERELNIDKGSKQWTNVLSAASLMKNNFDIVEHLSDIESIAKLPKYDSIHVFDLCWKLMKTLEVRAQDRSMYINVYGEQCLIMGSNKSFPLVPQILIENALKYGHPSTKIDVSVSAQDSHCLLVVRNTSYLSLDTKACFERGSRFAESHADGAGLGLYLAKAIVQAHDGQITCKKDNDHVIMQVRLPLYKVLPS